MPEDAEQSTTDEISTDGGKSSGLNKVRNFFTMGGDKKKWTKTLIVSAAVFFVFGFLATAVWGMALSFLSRSIAEPSGANAGVNGLTCGGNVIPNYSSTATLSDGKSYTIKNDGKGIVVQEDHNKTTADPPSVTPADLVQHLAVTNFAANCPSSNSVCKNTHWTPAAGGGAYGSSSRTPPPDAEPWMINFNIVHNGKKLLPPAGTRVIVYAPKTKKAIIAAGGYEWGPETYSKWVAGVKPEVLAQLGIQTNDRIETGFSSDQTLSYGMVFGDCVQNFTNGTVDVNNLASWYYGQGQQPWGDKPGQCSGWSVNKYSARGCAVTSAAMIARYYGKNINPYQMGAEMCSNGTIGLDVGKVANLIGKSYKGQSNPSISYLQSALTHGPVLAQGVKAFQASGQHWVVIVSISGDKMIISDPTIRNVGGSGKEWSTSEVSKLTNVYYFY